MMKIKFIINKALGGYKSGAEISLDCCNVKGDMVPTDSYWYRRYRDAKIDQCITHKEVKKTEYIAPEENKGIKKTLKTKAAE